MICTVGPMATTGERCGEPAVIAFGEFGECITHAPAYVFHVPAAEKVALPRFCRRAICIEIAMGAGRVEHLVGECK